LEMTLRVLSFSAGRNVALAENGLDHLPGFLFPERHVRQAHASAASRFRVRASSEKGSGGGRGQTRSTGVRATPCLRPSMFHLKHRDPKICELPVSRASLRNPNASMSQPTILDPSADRAAVLEAFSVSRETSARLDRFLELLSHWQRTTNLVASSTLPTVWSRHVADSLQLLDLVPRSDPSATPTWVDLGSGGGFPGLVIACALAEVPGARIHLIESRARKAAFLREAAQETGAPAVIHCGRIEDVGPPLRLDADIITARGLAPLPQLCDLVAPILKKGAKALLPKGQDLEAELTEATKYWNIDFVSVPSRTSSAGRIMVVGALSRRRSVPGRTRGADAR
jgi:16S rRNA (guanine527-N7)-methyltransferase